MDKETERMAKATREELIGEIMAWRDMYFQMKQERNELKVMLENVKAAKKPVKA